MNSILQITFQNNKGIRMLVSKLTKSSYLFAILLISLVIQQCTPPKTFIWKVDKSDQILDGSVQKDVLNNPEKFPWFYYGKAAYKPNKLIIEQLKAIDTTLFVMVFAGSWCADTQKELPIFYKVMEEIGLPNNHTGILMLNKNKQSTFFNVNAMEIKQIPTFILYHEGKEIGRIIEKTDSTMEYDIWKICEKAAAFK